MSDLNKITKYIADNDIEAIVSSVLKSNRDVWTVMQQVKEARVAFQIKSQMLQDELSKHLLAWEVGMTLEAQEDCLNNWRKGDRVEVTHITEDGAVLDGAADIEDKWIRRYFKVFGYREEE